MLALMATTMSLNDKVETIRTQLGLPPAPMFETVEKAVQELGLGPEVAGLPLVRKADACLLAIGVEPASSSVPLQAVGVPIMATVVEPVPAEPAVPIGRPVTVPVAQAVQQQAPHPPAATTNRLKLVLRAGGGLALEAGDVDATYGRRAFHIRRTPHAHEAIEVEFRANGNVAVASGHHTLGHCLDNWHGRNTVGNRQHFSTWYRTHGGHAALRFRFNNDDATISPVEAPHLVLGCGDA